MMKEFEVGKEYEAYGWGVGAIKILQRTPKTVKVSNGFVEWRMRIDHDSCGNEVVTDKKMPRKWHYAFTYSANLERTYN